MHNHFTIKIPCKKYVKAYLEINCGKPVDLKHLPDLLEELRRGLARKPCHREASELAKLKDMVTVIIPPDVFYRYGWELNKESTLDFNRRVEMKVKFFMRNYVAVNKSLGIPVANCIKEFQDEFGFYESVWNYESIKKDFDRHGRVPELKIIRELKVEINKILLDNLSDLGTISKKLKKEYIYG
jgi:hypothetical protein